MEKGKKKMMWKITLPTVQLANVFLIECVF